jgi:hypothetical protein
MKLAPGLTAIAVIPGREPRAKLTESILSLGERTRNPEQCMVLDSGSAPSKSAVADLDHDITELG